jgi:hypothetical protein
MTISDRNRTYFEAIGLADIGRELVVGSVLYPGDANDRRRAEAREWVDEQNAKREQEKREAREREAKTLGWTIAGVIVAIVAAVAAIIAAWPVIREWIR